MSNQFKDTLRRLGARENATGICPVCNVPTGNCTVYRDPAHYTVRCWRGSCGAVTRLPAESLAETSEALDGIGSDNGCYYSAPTRALHDQEVALIANTYSLYHSTVLGAGIVVPDVKRDPEIPSYDYLLLVSSWDGRHCGHLLHRMRPEYGPKRIAYRVNRKKPWMAYVRSARNWEAAPVALVEDHFSAYRLAEAGVNAVALMGTALSGDKLRDLGAAFGRHEKFALCLDSDVFPHACALARTWPSLVPVFIGSTDVKDKPREELGAIVTRIEHATGRRAAA